MIFFLYGENTFLSKRKLSEITKKYRSKYKSGLNLLKIEATNDGFEKMKDFIETISMFSEKKLLVLKNLLSSPKEIQKKFQKYLKEKKIAKSENINIIIFEETKPDKKSIFFKELFKSAFKKQEFNKIDGPKLRYFIKKEVEELGSKIENKAIEKLILYCNGDIWQIENEIQKLTSFKEKEIIKEEDVEKICVANIDLNIFETIEAIAKKEKQKALSLIREHFKKGENELKILSMINYQFRNLIKIKSLIEEKKNFYQIQKMTNLHPFVVKKTMFLARKFNFNELKEIYRKLFEIDFAIKTGKIEPQLGIENFIIEI